MRDALPVRTDRSFSAEEYIDLMTAAQWGDAADYDPATVEAAREAYHFVGHVRNEDGVLVGCCCAFSDSAFATFVVQLVVHPFVQGRGIGASLLEAVERAYPGIPVFALGFREARGFFLRKGFTIPSKAIEVFARLNARPAMAETG